MLIANRRLEESHESAIGHFVNTVVLPIDVSDKMTLDDLLEVTRKGVLTIQEYQEFPFEALASAVESRSYSNREYLCRALIAYNVEGFLDEMPGVTFAPLYLKEAQMAEEPQCYRVRFHF